MNPYSFAISRAIGAQRIRHQQKCGRPNYAAHVASQEREREEAEMEADFATGEVFPASADLEAKNL